MGARQVLIDLDWASTLRNDNMLVICDKANKALATMQGTLEHQAKAVTKLHNGGILLELNSNVAVVRNTGFWASPMLPQVERGV